jgi:hypothetical protein
MIRKVRAAAATAVAVLCLGACGQVDVEQVDAAAPGTRSASPTPEEPVPTPNSDEPAAKQDVDFDDFYERLETWVASDFVQSLDPKSLPPLKSMRDPAQGYASLDEAVDHADLAVLGTVIKTKFIARGALRTTFRIERVAKGSPQETVTIDQIDLTLSPKYDQATGPEWSAKPKIGTTPASPPIFVGDRAVLLLEEKGDGSDGYYIQNFSGQYRSTKGRVKTLPACDFHDVDGLTERALLERIEAHAKHDQTPGPTPLPRRS